MSEHHALMRLGLRDRGITVGSDGAKLARCGGS